MKRSITVRVEEKDAERLEQQARLRRQADGDNVSTSDVIREAIAAHLQRLEAAQ